MAILTVCTSTQRTILTASICTWRRSSTTAVAWRLCWPVAGIETLLANSESRPHSLHLALIAAATVDEMRAAELAALLGLPLLETGSDPVMLRERKRGTYC